ncbi:MAG: MBL fold metallo-hydrolase [Christensenellales bacterium]|jgi:hydroxyacylglutathione hydrolase
MVMVYPLTVGMLEANCYIVMKKEHKDCIVVDPGGDFNTIDALLQRLRCRPSHVFLTHGHFDHIGATAALAEKYGSLVCIHETEKEALTSDEASLATMAGLGSLQKTTPDIFLNDGDRMTAAGMTVEVMHTPGHSRGSVCLIIGDNLFSGDTLFFRSIGRTDFPGGDGRVMAASLNRLSALSRDYTVYPGHMQQTLLSDELMHNPYMSGRQL